jgi:RNA polymerase sigma-70 factor (ECF subfamily)
MVRVLSFHLARIVGTSFESLLRPHLEYLHRLAWRFTGSVADAEDLVQDLLLKLYPRRRELAAVEKLRPWLAKVLYRQYVDLVRQRARSPSAGLADGAEEELEALPAEEAGPEQHAERGEWRERILAALAQLSPEQRAVVVMHDIEGYVLEELEGILQVPLGTLKSRLHRARQKLRAQLGMEPFAAGERVKR